MFELLQSLLGIFILYAIIVFLWQLTEKKFYGKVTPRVLDDAIAIILAISLFYNLK